MEKRGVASIAILPSGSISGHFVDSLTSQCFGLFGTQIACERECSRGEDYKLINISILDFHSKREVQVIVESHGQDAARFENATDIHGWEEDVMEALQRKDKGACVPSIKFDCEILKADADAERHLEKYLPSLVGHGAVVNIGSMEIKGLKFERTHEAEGTEDQRTVTSNAETETIHDDGGDDDARDDDDGTTNGLGSELACDASTTTTLTGACSTCVPSDREFAGILQKELEEQGLSMNGCPKDILTSGWIEKRIMQQEGSQDSF